MQTKSDQQIQKLIGTLFPLIGIALLVGTGVSIPVTNRFINTASRAEGTVIKLNAGRAHPSVEFTPVDGTKVEFSGQGWIDYGVGDRVPVLYLKDPENPAGYQISIDTIGALWFGQFVGTWIGTGFVLSGLFMKYGSNSKP